MGSYDRWTGPTLEDVKKRVAEEKHREERAFARMLVSEAYKALNKTVTKENFNTLVVPIVCKDETEYRDVMWHLSWDDDEQDDDDSPDIIFAYYGIEGTNTVLVGKTWAAIQHAVENRP